MGARRNGDGETAVAVAQNFTRAENQTLRDIVDRKAATIDDPERPIARGGDFAADNIKTSRIERRAGIIVAGDELQTLAGSERDLAASLDRRSCVWIGFGRAAFRGGRPSADPRRFGAARDAQDRFSGPQARGKTDCAGDERFEQNVQAMRSGALSY